MNKCIYLMLMFCCCISFIRAVLSQHDSEYYNYTNAANNDTQLQKWFIDLKENSLRQKVFYSVLFLYKIQ